jgi:ATP-dependent Clp protease ATP-binding subunit ClpB
MNRQFRTDAGTASAQRAVDEEDIAEVVARWTTSRCRATGGEVQKASRWRRGLHQRLIGQNDAVVAVSNAIRRARAGLQDRIGRSAASFSGPTGVGQDRTGARTLAEFLFDDEQAMVRIDMSEYQEKHTVRASSVRLRVRGYEEAGQLTRGRSGDGLTRSAVRRNRESPSEVLKRHAPVAGRRTLTDGKGDRGLPQRGRPVMTSNVGSHVIADRAVRDTTLDEGRATRVTRHPAQHFKPRF